MSDTLDTVITKAMDKEGITFEGEDSTPNQPLPIDDKSRETPATAVETKTEDEDLGLTKEDLKEAKLLYAKLKDPNQRQEVVDFIATQSGYTKAQVREIKEAITETIAEKPKVKDFSTILKEKLGPEFDYLSERLSGALEEIIDSKTKSIKEDVVRTNEAQLVQAFQSELSDTVDEISTKTYEGKGIPENVAIAMSKVMDELPCPPTMQPKNYMKLVHDTAVGRVGLTKTTAAPRVTRPSDTLPSRNQQPIPTKNLAGPKEPGLDAAIEFAMEQLVQESKVN